MDEKETDEISTLDKHGCDKLLSRLVDYHGAPRRDIPPQLAPTLTRRLPAWRRAA
jgi:hypothetical protein